MQLELETLRGCEQINPAQLALRTGGQFSSPRRDEDLTRAFARIANELRSQYLLTYVPRNTNAEQSFRPVRIEVGDSKSGRNRPRLFYRPGYYFKVPKVKESFEY